MQITQFLGIKKKEPYKNIFTLNWLFSNEDILGPVYILKITFIWLGFYKTQDNKITKVILKFLFCILFPSLFNVLIFFSYVHNFCYFSRNISRVISTKQTIGMINVHVFQCTLRNLALILLYHSWLNQQSCEYKAK